MRYSSIVSIMALGLASFSVAAPVGSNPPNGNGDTPGEGGPFDGFTGGLTGALGKGGIPGLPAGLGGDSSGSGSGSGSSSKRDVHASPEGAI
ncbi:hypothetical protein BDV38DRAFT_277798 [Aspergillus pseudotamarii]|uniref:Uncharacterized protein n=1 Tax=Aspergillus pseudotamarii TaxID=132259 RepID=A0A5N6T9X7_ASPPS|nr:uncharacterized protein BDV38DRAFT_277798 [Aspergillus pseudotamarii]KAE8142989.1 hypothetical protein BDV38DRAFT_277798 [Aspergillus pseudotamarii]